MKIKLFIQSIYVRRRPLVMMVGVGVGLGVYVKGKLMEENGREENSFIKNVR